MIQFRKNYYADVRIEDRFETQIAFLNENLNQCKQTSVKKAFLRVFDGEMWYYASTCDVDNVQKELDALYASAHENKQIGAHPLVKKFQVNRDSVKLYEKNSLRDVPLKTKLDRIDGIRKRIAADPYVKFLHAVYSDRHSTWQFYSSLGADISYDVQYCKAIAAVNMADGEKTHSTHIVKAAVSFDELTFSDQAIADFLKENDDFLLHAEAVEPGEYPVILSPEAGGIFAHESFGHKSEADFMLGDETMKKEWQLGKTVGSPLLSIYDTGLQPGTGYVPYDDEGTRATKTYLIKNGVLTGRLHSAETAAELGEATTGNARAVDCTFEPIVRMTNTVIESGTSTFDELLAPIKHGYFIKTVQHGSGMSTFTIAPLLAYEIVDGKLTKPVKISVVTGNVFETLGLIDGVGKNAVVEPTGGNCGKMEQFPLNVGFGAPYVRVSKMRVQ